MNSPNFGVVQVSGPDAQDFLNRVTTQDFKNLAVNTLSYAALLDPYALVISVFAVFREDKTYWLAMDQKLAQKTCDELEKLHFVEDLSIKNYMPTSAPDELVNGVRILLDDERPQYSVDYTEKTMILELPFSEAVSRSKGCYPGQEVVERIHTYSNVAKKLVGLRWKKTSDNLKPSVSVFVEKDGVKENAGRVTSLHSDFAFASIRKPYYEIGQKLFSEKNDEYEVFLPTGTFVI